MKRTLLILASLAGLPLAASAAEGVSYNYVQAGYAKIDSRLRDFDADGWSVAGSHALHPNVHVFGGYAKQKVDSYTVYIPGFGFGRAIGADTDLWHLGVGYNRELSKRVDLVGRISYEYAKSEFEGFEGYSVKGYHAEVGVRGALAANWEGYALAGYRDYNYGFPGKFYGLIGTQVKFNQNWGIVADAKFIDGGQKEFFIGPRLSF